MGSGSWGSNSISENVGVKRLLNLKTIAERRENMLWYRAPPKVYFKYGCLNIALKDEDKKRVFIVADKVLYDQGFVEKVISALEAMDIDCKVFYDVEQDPTLATARKGATEMLTYQTNTVIALGGGSQWMQRILRGLCKNILKCALWISESVFTHSRNLEINHKWWLSQHQ